MSANKNIGYGIIGTPDGYQHASFGFTANRKPNVLDLDVSILANHPEKRLYAVVFEEAKGKNAKTGVITYIARYEGCKELERNRTGAFFGCYVAFLHARPDNLGLKGALETLDRFFDSHKDDFVAEGRYQNRITSSHNTLKQASFDVELEPIESSVFTVAVGNAGKIIAFDDLVNTCNSLLKNNAFFDGSTYLLVNDKALLEDLQAKYQSRFITLDTVKKNQESREVFYERAKTTAKEIEDLDEKLETRKTKLKEYLNKLESLTIKQPLENPEVAKYNQRISDIKRDVQTLGRQYDAYNKQNQQLLKDITSNVAVTDIDALKDKLTQFVDVDSKAQLDFTRQDDLDTNISKLPKAPKSQSKKKTKQVNKKEADKNKIESDNRDHQEKTQLIVEGMPFDASTGLASQKPSLSVNDSAQPRDLLRGAEDIESTGKNKIQLVLIGLVLGLALASVGYFGIKYLTKNKEKSLQPTAIDNSHAENNDSVDNSTQEEGVNNVNEYKPNKANDVKPDDEANVNKLEIPTEIPTLDEPVTHHSGEVSIGNDDKVLREVKNPQPSNEMIPIPSANNGEPLGKTTIFEAVEPENTNKKQATALAPVANDLITIGGDEYDGSRDTSTLHLRRHTKTCKSVVNGVKKYDDCN